MIVIPDPNVYAKLWVVEIGQDILKQEDFKQGIDNYLNREGDRLIVYTVEGNPPPGLRPIRLAFRTPPPVPADHLSTGWLDAVSYVAGQNMSAGPAPFSLNLTNKNSDGFRIQITLPNDLNGGVYTNPRDRVFPNGQFVLRYQNNGNVVINRTSTPTSPEMYFWDAINSPNPKWFSGGLPNSSSHFSYGSGIIKRISKSTGAVIDQYQIQAGVSGSTYLGVNNNGGVEIFPSTPSTPPTLTSISPNTGATSGATRVALTGTGFTGATSVILGGAPARNVTMVNATTITCDTPSRIVGPVNVMVTTPGGVNAANTLFTYITPLVSQPFLYLPLDGNTQDASGNNRHGTASGGLT